jgi:sensor histidine kinase regulating citrate/malate metabolism
MQEIEAVCLYDLVHSDSKSEVVRRELEKRIPPDVDFMEVDVRKKRRQPERLAICNEVNLVAARSESDAELCRYCT